MYIENYYLLIPTKYNSSQDKLKPRAGTKEYLYISTQALPSPFKNISKRKY